MSCCMFLTVFIHENDLQEKVFLGFMNLSVCFNNDLSIEAILRSVFSTYS